jgi:hypothetical protein
MTAHKKATPYKLAGRPEVALYTQINHTFILSIKQDDMLADRPFCIIWQQGYAHCEKPQWRQP